MTLPTLLFVEPDPGTGIFLATADVPNRIFYSVSPGPVAWKARVAGTSGRVSGLGHHPTLDAAFRACEAHFLRQRPA